jgi:hypothetical protein
MDEKIDVDDEEKIYVTSRDSCSEGELSEDPLPTEQRKQPLPQRKQLICIDTPIVREAKINISALSKLRKRKSTEDCTEVTYIFSSSSTSIFSSILLFTIIT